MHAFADLGQALLMLTGARFHEEHTLDDGTEVVLRHIRPSDEEELKRGFERLSSASRYLRFQGVMKELSPKALHYLTHVDGHDHVAIVATTRPDANGHASGLGVARFVRSKNDPALAEVALTVIDEAQHKGLGRILGIAIARAALERHVHRFTGPILRDNVAIRRLLEEVGATFRPTADGLEFEITLRDREEPMIERILRLFLRVVATSMHPHEDAVPEDPDAVNAS